MISFVAFIIYALILIIGLTTLASATTIINAEQNVDEYNSFSKYEKLIEKYGHKAVSFLECMGPKWVDHCTSPTLKCLETRDVTGCISLIECEGRDAETCVHHLK